MILSPEGYQNLFKDPGRISLFNFTCSFKQKRFPHLSAALGIANHCWSINALGDWFISSLVYD